MPLDDQLTPQPVPPPAGASAASVPHVQSTINVADNQGTVIGTQIINQPRAAPTLHQLRAPVGDFVGRASEIEDLVQALSTAAGKGGAALGCVRGMAGAGKTELAYTVAQRLNVSFPDAQLLVDLRGASPTPLSPSQALQTLIRAFEREAKLPDDVDELTGIYNAVLAGKRALILADDAEDVAQVRPLSPPAGCALLITSRNRFALPAMHTLDLHTLPPEDGELLLLAICPRIGADAAALAKQCGYLPLALRVSAGLLATNDTRPVSSCLAHIGAAQLSYLSDPDDPAASVETSLRLSYDDLTPDGQAALCQLSVFPTSFDAAAAQAVVAVASDSSGALELLRRHSLLEWDAALERYGVQDLVRVFGAVRLEDADSVRLRHARHYLQVASFAVQELYLKKGETLAGLALFDRERAQIDAGWSWARGRAGDPDADELLLSYASATLDISILRYNVRTERIPQLEAWRAAAQRLAQPDQERLALGNLGIAYTDLSDLHKAIDCFEQALAIARAIGNRNGVGQVLGSLGVAYAALGDASKAMTYQEQALVIMRELGDRRGEGDMLVNLGVVYVNLSDASKAMTYQEQALVIMRELGDRQGEANALGNLGFTSSVQGDAPKAIEYYEQALVIMRELGDRRGEGNTLSSLGQAQAHLGAASKASEYYEQALVIARELGDRHAESYQLGNLGYTYADLGDAPKAIMYQEQRLAIARDIDDPRETAFASWALGDLRATQGDLAQAVELMQMSVDVMRVIGYPHAEDDAAVVEQLRQQLAGEAAGTHKGRKMKGQKPRTTGKARKAKGA